MGYILYLTNKNKVCVAAFLHPLGFIGHPLNFCLHRLVCVAV